MSVLGSPGRRSQPDVLAGVRSRPAPAPVRAPASRLAALVLVAVGAAVAGLAFAPGFTGTGLTVPVLAAAVLPVVVTAVSTRGGERRVPAVVSVAATGLAWLLVTASQADGTAGIASRVGTAGREAVDSWWTFLDTTLPAPTTSDLVVLPVTLTWIAAFVGAELAVRTRTVAWPTAPAAVVLGVAVAGTAGTPGSAVVQATVLVVVTGLLVPLRRADPGPRQGQRHGQSQGQRHGQRHGHGHGPQDRSDRSDHASDSRLRGRVGVTALVTVTVCAVGAALLGPSLSIAGDHRYDPRQDRTLAAHNYPTLSPLGQVAGWLAKPDRPMFSVTSATSATSATPAEPSALRLCVLDHYDGVSWTAPETFVRTGGRVPAEPSPTPRGDAVEQTIEIQQLDGGFLPAVDRPEQVTVATPAGASTAPVLGVSPDTGVLVLAGTPTDGLRYDGLRYGGLPFDGLRYTVRSRPAPAYDSDRLASAGLGSGVLGSAAEPLTAYPEGLPDEIRALAAVGADAATPYTAAVAVQNALRAATYEFDPAAPAGHSYGHLRYFLKTLQRGSYEQFVTAFALAVRVLGMPSRVVVGFRPGSSGELSAGAGGPTAAVAASGGVVRSVRSGDVEVWDEVYFAGLGWLPFRPTPDARTGPAEDVVPAGAAGGSPPQPHPSVPATQPAPGLPVAPEPAQQSHDSVVAAVAVAGLVVAGAVYVTVVLAVPRARRRRWRARGTPRERIVRAWDDALAGLAFAGCTLPAATTPAETAAVVAAWSAPRRAGRGRPLGGLRAAESVEALALLLDRAAYAPDAVPERLATMAWSYADALRPQVEAVVPWHRRQLARLRPSAARR